MAPGGKRCAFDCGTIIRAGPEGVVSIASAETRRPAAFDRHYGFKSPAPDCRLADAKRNREFESLFLRHRVLNVRDSLTIIGVLGFARWRCAGEGLSGVWVGDCVGFSRSPDEVPVAAPWAGPWTHARGRTCVCGPLRVGASLNQFKMDIPASVLAAPDLEARPRALQQICTEGRFSTFCFHWRFSDGITRRN
jgi:hypothetical protein